VAQAGAATTGLPQSPQPSNSPAALHAGVINTAAAIAPAIVRPRTAERNMASPPNTKKRPSVIKPQPHDVVNVPPSVILQNGWTFWLSKLYGQGKPFGSCRL
jgi:hypothetical protein